MHHCRCCQGFSLLFQERSDGFWRDLLNEAQLDGFARQQAQRPMVMSVGDRAAGEGDEVRLLRAAERLAIADLPLVV
jgi:hypothetical protein